jgi:hypothetical protein
VCWRLAQPCASASRYETIAKGSTRCVLSVSALDRPAIDMSSGLQSELRQLVRTEEQRVLDSFPHPERRVAVLELVRSADLLFLWLDSYGAKLSPAEQEAQTFQIYGCNRVLQLFVDESCQHSMVPLFPSTKPLREWARVALIVCGRIAVVERLLDCEHAGLGRFTTKGSEIHFDYEDQSIGFEDIEGEEFNWLRSYIVKHDESKMKSLIEIESEIEKLMKPLVRTWRKHYIAYSTTPEIDTYYQHRGILVCRQMFGQDTFKGDTPFGRLQFDHYRATVATIVGWMLKHLQFARLLKKKVAGLETANVVTIHQEKDVLAKYLASALEIDLTDAQQSLKTLTLTADNKRQLCVPRGVPPPLIELGKEHVVKSVAGCLDAPFYFMTASLRHDYRDDWDRAVSGREGVFREELYSLFPQDQLVCVPHSVTIRLGNTVLTDIDAAIFDPRNHMAGLFQLKWQEPFGPSIRARESRKRNFLQETAAWVGRIFEFLDLANARNIADSFGLKLKVAEQIKSFRIFVVGRNFSHFSGQHPPDDRAAWGLWPQVLRLAAEEYNHTNPIAGLYDGLMRDSPFSKPRITIEGTKFILGGKQIVLNGVS